MDYGYKIGKEVQNELRVINYFFSSDCYWVGIPREESMNSLVLVLVNMAVILCIVEVMKFKLEFEIRILCMCAIGHICAFMYEVCWAVVSFLTK